MLKVTKGVVSEIISNLDHYYPETEISDVSKIFDLNKFLKNFSNNEPTYTYGLKEIANMGKYYGEKRIVDQEYYGPLLNQSKLYEQWPYFKFMILHNFMVNQLNENELWEEIFRNFTINFEEIIKLAKIILMIPSNSACVERGIIIT